MPFLRVDINLGTRYYAKQEHREVIMFSETTQQLLKASEELAKTRESISSKPSKKSPMEKIHYRFNSQTKNEISELAFNISSKDSKWSESDVARAAMYIGMKQIKEVLDHDKKQANGLMHIIKLRLKFFK